MTHRSGELALVRDEIWSVSREYFEAGDWDKAIFDAFKKVESLTQQRIGNSNLIGNALFSEAFDTTTPRIVISRDSKDLASLSKLFAGAVGMYKGDRSHDEPMINIESQEECLRILIVASALLDILDHDEEIAPRIRSVSPVNNRALQLIVERLTPSTKFYVNGQPVVVTRSIGSVVNIQLPEEISGGFDIVAQDGSRSGKVFKYQMPSSSAGNWHRVEGFETDLFTSADLTERHPYRAVILRSNEAGREFIRRFPTKADYKPGEYLTWEWDLASKAGRTWWNEEGKPALAWDASTFFAGTPLGSAGPERLQFIELRPSHMLLQVGERAPFRVFGLYGDGTASWTRDITSTAFFENENDEVTAPAHTTTARGARGVSLGRSRMTASHGNLHSRAEISVNSVSRGDVSEFIGGYQRLSTVVSAADGLYFANQGNFIYKMGKDLSVEPVIALEVPVTFHTGIDYFALTGTREAYVRAIWDNSVRKIDLSNKVAGKRTVLPEGLTVMQIGWSPGTGALIADHIGTIWSWHGDKSAPQRWAALPALCMDLKVTQNGIIALLNTAVLIELDFSGKIVSEKSLAELHGKSVSAVERVGDSYYIACFNSGEIYELQDDGDLEVFAAGFQAPSSLTLHDNNKLLVTNFGGDSISKIYL